MTLLAFLAGAFVVAVVAYPVCSRLERHLQDAHNRLYGAWKDGALIPPPEPDTPPEPLPPIPDELRGYIEEWSSPNVRAQMEERIRRMQARRMSTADIGKTLLLERDTQRTPFDGRLAPRDRAL